MQRSNIKKLSVTAMLTALAFLLTFVFRFKVGFLTFDFKDAIISIASLLYGPLYGIASAALVALIEFVSVSDTGVYGLIMNFASSGTFALVLGTIYMRRKSFSGAIIASVSAVVSVVTVMMLANILVTPYYMGVSVGEVINLIPIMLLPFNLAKAIINAAAMLLIYKPFTSALKKAGLVTSSGYSKSGFGLRSVLLMIISALIVVLTALYLILGMHGQFTLI